MRLSPIGHGVARARELYRQHANAARSTDEFLADRREEVARELKGLSAAEAAEATK